MLHRLTFMAAIILTGNSAAAAANKYNTMKIHKYTIRNTKIPIKLKNKYKCKNKDKFNWLQQLSQETLLTIVKYSGSKNTKCYKC